MGRIATLTEPWTSPQAGEGIAVERRGVVAGSWSARWRLRLAFDLRGRASLILACCGLRGSSREDLSADEIVGKQTWTTLLRHWLLFSQPGEPNYAI
jgi:hypothetical protein